MKSDIMFYGSTSEWFFTVVGCCWDKEIFAEEERIKQRSEEWVEVGQETGEKYEWKDERKVFQEEERTWVSSKEDELKEA